MMGQLELGGELWAWITRDVSLVGGLQSPLLSWFGAGGIALLFLWHTLFLLLGAWRLRAATERILPPLERLARVRREKSPEWIIIPALAKKHANGSAKQEGRRDLDDLEALDRIMRAEPAYAPDWLSFRKTLAIEQASWFMEPTVHAGKPAAEFFSFEALCAQHLNVRFYQQFPSLLTGLGLMCTFVAILIGLSRLHADGAHIEGLQGLINGLAGKFLTSIVGLACANAFLLLEKSLWHGLDGRHRRIVALLDEVFPQKVLDRSALNGSPLAGHMVSVPYGVVDHSAQQLVEAMHLRLQAAVDALNSVSATLASRGKQDLSAHQEQLASEIGREMRRALGAVCEPLWPALQEIARSLQALRLPQRASPEDMASPVDAFKERFAREPAMVAGGSTGQTGRPFVRVGRRRTNATRPV